jgi:cyclopropane-fatty-acyl-phospholipid synthase
MEANQVVADPYGGASMEAIQHHYDLSNAFYNLWLDETMTYSSALWEGASSLSEAQIRKFDYHIDSAHVRGAECVLDIGCGWGAMMARLVDEAGVKSVVGLTLSEAQAEWIRKRDDARVEVRVENWESHQPKQLYDSIISIGAFEHFARPDIARAEVVESYRKFFLKCREWLKPDGRLSLQTIAYGTARREDLNRFIIEEIFPESDLPTLADIDQASHRLFEVERVRNDRHDYERTLKEWYFNLRARKDEAIAVVGPDAVVRYEKYLSLFAVGFHTGAMNLFRIVLRRVDRR